MKKLFVLLVILLTTIFIADTFAQTASVTWALSNTSQLTSANVGTIVGSSESIGAGSGNFGMSVFDYNSNGQRLWEGTAGWLAGTEEATRYIQFDAQPASVNSLTVTNVSFNYGAAGIDNNIKSNVYYSTDGWKTRTSLNAAALSYSASSMLSFTQNISVAVISGSTFSLRVYPYSVVNSSPVAPTFAVHNNVVINGTTTSKKNSILQLTSVVGKWGKSVLLTAHLFETGLVRNTDLPNQEVKFYKISPGTREGDTAIVYIGSGTTNTNGVANLSFTIPQDSIAGSISVVQDSVSHSIRASFAGDANYFSQSGTGKLTIQNHSSSVTVPPLNARYGSVMLSAMLTDLDNNGSGIPNQVIKFDIAEGNGLQSKIISVGSSSTNANGAASIAYTIPQDSISRSITATFTGDANFTSKIITVPLAFSLKNSSIQVTNAAGKWGKQIFLTVKLQETGAVGNTNLSNKMISFSREQDSVNGLGNAKYKFIGTGTTDANGVASIAYTIPQDSISSLFKAPQDSVTHTIRAEFIGDANYNLQSSTGKLIVIRHAANLSVAPTISVYGQTVTFTASLMDNDNNGKGVSDQVLKFYKISPGSRLGDTVRVFIASSKTNASGVASVSYSLPQDSVISSISVVFAGDVNYSSKVGRGTFTSPLKNSAIQITDAAGKWNTTVQLTAKLQESGAAGNIPLPNKLVKFYFDKIFINQGTTNSEGMASIMYTIPQDSVANSISNPQDSVAHSLTASFSGDVNYNSQSMVGKLIVVRHSTNISVASVNGKSGQSVTLMATLTDNDNARKGIPNQVITFKISENQSPLPNDRATTDANGIASLTYKLPQDSVASTHTISAVYNGNGNYSSQTGTGKLNSGSVGIENNLVGLPTKFDLSQNYPNPFNPTSTIRYDIPKAGYVNLSVYDILGREVRTLVSEQKNPGHYEILFDAKELSSGIYFYTIHSAEFSQSKKMILMK